MTNKGAKKNSFFTSERIEGYYDVKLPERIKSFIDTGEYKNYNGLYVSSLPGYTVDTRFKVKFDDKQLLELLEENDIEMPDADDSFYLPICRLGGEPQFMAVNISEGNLCPVAMWEHEDESFHEHSDSLDSFLKTLSKK